MMIKNLPAEEVHTVMGYMRHAVKDTYFEKWLASGGFQWPTNPSMPSTKVGTTYSLLWAVGVGRCGGGCCCYGF